jgi:uncharacterized protein with HEPN domain
MRDDMTLFRDMLNAAEKILTFVNGLSKAEFEASDLHQSAVVRKLQVVGEAARLITSATKAAHPEIEWMDIIGMRNLVIHEYFRVDIDIVWNTIRKSIPELIVQINAVISSSTSQDDV